MTQPVDTRARPVAGPTPGLGLRHVLVVGGTPREWASMAGEAWDTRVARLGQYCDQLGVAWLTIRVYGQSPGDDPSVTPTSHTVGGCAVFVDPCGDGRRRFAEAMQRIPPEVPISERSVAAALYAPADAEPDLVVVLGPPTQLPPSLVWELAYAELVFLPVEWGALTADDLAQAAAEFASRHRRFGGLDPD